VRRSRRGRGGAVGGTTERGGGDARDGHWRGADGGCRGDGPTGGGAAWRPAAPGAGTATAAAAAVARGGTGGARRRHGRGAACACEQSDGGCGGHPGSAGTFEFSRVARPRPGISNKQGEGAVTRARTVRSVAAARAGSPRRALRLGRGVGLPRCGHHHRCLGRWRGRWAHLPRPLSFATHPYRPAVVAKALAATSLPRTCTCRALC